MTKKEAKRLVKTRAASKYRGSALTLLQHMVDASFRASDGPEDARHTVSVRASTLMRWINVKEAQLHSIMKTFRDDGIGAFTRVDGMVTFHLNLDPLNKFREYDPTAEREARLADRATKARAARAATRNAVKDMLFTSILANASANQQRLDAAL